MPRSSVSNHSNGELSKKKKIIAMVKAIKVKYFAGQKLLERLIRMRILHLLQSYNLKVFK